MNRKEHWDKAHAARHPREVSWYQQLPALSLRMIQNSNMAMDTPLIDVGGGASLLVDFLLEEGYRNITVLDLSGIALKKARRRLGEQASKVEWIEQDITRFEAERIYGLWHDRALFHFLTLEYDREKYIQALRRALQPGGQLVISTFAIGGPARCSGLDIVQYDARKLERELGEEFTLLEQEQVRHQTPAQKEQLFGFYRFIRH
jgi:SAM-dependent methyltransferase